MAIPCRLTIQRGRSTRARDGKRDGRWYRASGDRLLPSCVNGAYNIARKGVPTAFGRGDRGSGSSAQAACSSQTRRMRIHCHECSILWENNRECYHCTVNHPQYIKSNFDIYEEGHGSPVMQERLEAALARSKGLEEAEGL